MSTIRDLDERPCMGPVREPSRILPRGWVWFRKGRSMSSVELDWTPPTLRSVLHVVVGYVALVALVGLVGWVWRRL